MVVVAEAGSETWPFTAAAAGAVPKAVCNVKHLAPFDRNDELREEVESLLTPFG